jgi:hypothetical protein
MSETIKNLSEHLAISPASIGEYTLDKMQLALEGDIDINEPTSPFMQLVQANAVNTAACMLRNDTADRKRYPNLALTISELLPHLNSDDLVDIFSAPIRNHIVNLSLSTQELTEYAIQDDARGIKFLEVPADTQFTCSGYSFMFHQPIEIRITPSGYISAVFKDEYDSPLLQRVGNKISVNKYKLSGTEFFNMAIPCDQLAIQTYEDVITTGQPWSVSAIIDNKFTYARGWYYTTTGVWTEIDVKFDRTYYDINVPTMILELTGELLNASIPDIYISNGMVGTKARIDIYNTKGYSSINLSAQVSDDWEIDFSDYSDLSGSNDEPLFSVGTRVIFSTDKTTGGTDGMSFEEVRKQVIYGDGIKLGAYTAEELVAVLEKRGYRSVLRRDTITDRIYVASRTVDNPDTLPSTGLSSGVGVTNAICVFDEEATDLPLSMITNVGCSVIKPVALYKLTNSTATIMSDVNRLVIEGKVETDKDSLVEELNKGTYAWSSLHTVLDYNNPVFLVRQYHLTSPSYEYLSVEDNNWLMGYSVDTTDVSLELVSQSTDNTMVAVNDVSPGFFSDVDLTKRDKYTIKVHGVIPKGVDNLHAQLVYEYLGEKFYLDSTVEQATETDVVFTFDLHTNLDIDTDDTFSIVMKKLYLNEEAVVRVGLESELSIVYLAETENVLTYFDIDNLIEKSIYNEGKVSTINIDTIGVKFGDHFDGLFNYGRTLLRATEYQTHKTSKQAVWSKDVPLRDADQQIVYEVDRSELPNKVNISLLYEKGTPRVDAAGDPIWEYEEGDYILDSDNKLIPVGGASNSELREVRFHLMDARFRYTTTDSVLDYIKEIPSTILSYLNKDVASLKKEMLERTELYYEPLATRSSAKVITEDNSDGFLAELAVEISVNFQLTKEGYLDESFKASLRTLAKSVIVAQLSTGVISTTTMTKNLYDLDRDKILTISITTPFGSDVHAYVKEDDGVFSLDKKLALQPNNTITISDTLSINFTK